MTREPSKRCLMLLWVIRMAACNLKKAEEHAIEGNERLAASLLYKTRDVFVAMLKDEERPKGPPDDIEEPAYVP